MTWQLLPGVRPQGDNDGPRWAGDCVRCQDHMVPDGAGWTEKTGRKWEGKSMDWEGLGRQSG